LAYSWLALGGLILLPVIHPLAAQRPTPPQRGGAPGADTPQLVVSVLASSDPSVGVAAADAIRRRMQSEHNATDLYLTPRPTIDQTLERSGFNPDSTLGESDLMALTKQVRGDYALAGTVERTTNGLRTSVRLLTQTGSLVVAEPLATIVGSDVGDIAKQVDRAVSEVIHALAFHHDCRKALLMGDYGQAMTAARHGLQLRPTSVALNLCVLSIFRATQTAPADSIIAVASAITAVDSTNAVAWATLADAYTQKGDSARSLGATLALHRLDAANVTVTLGLVDRLVGAGQPQPALAVLDSALRIEPANADLLGKRWLLHLRLGQYARALASGAALIAVDSAAATSDYYERQLAVAKAAHDSVATHRLAIEATGRFPTNVSFLLIRARDAVDQGAPRDGLAFAQRVLTIEPANGFAWQIAITAYARLDRTDSAVAVARRALTAGVPQDAVSGSLIAVVAPALDTAQRSHQRADWERVLHAAQAVDSVASSPRSQFYVGVAAFQIAADEIQSLADFAKLRTPTRAQRQTACASATELEDLVRLVSHRDAPGRQRRSSDREPDSGGGAGLFRLRELREAGELPARIARARDLPRQAEPRQAISAGCRGTSYLETFPGPPLWRTCKAPSLPLSRA
jgi:tetratricopeptide (TPR) repeat protein